MFLRHRARELVFCSALVYDAVRPKGWKLPNVNGVSEKGSFYYLLSQYGVQSKIEAESNVSGSDGTLNTYNIALSPLFLVRAGGVYSNDTTAPFQSAGFSGRYWSSRAYSNTSSAYSLAFSTSVNPSYGGANRYYGFSLRCLIPTP